MYEPTGPGGPTDEQIDECIEFGVRFWSEKIPAEHRLKLIQMAQWYCAEMKCTPREAIRAVMVTSLYISTSLPEVSMEEMELSRPEDAALNTVQAHEHYEDTRHHWECHIKTSIVQTLLVALCEEARSS